MSTSVYFFARASQMPGPNFCHICSTCDILSGFSAAYNRRIASTCSLADTPANAAGETSLVVAKEPEAADVNDEALGLATEDEEGGGDTATARGAL